jgi:phage shock protein A
VEYVQILEKMNNIYNVDLYAMLDLAVDRRAALDKYLKEMNNLIDQGDLALASIQGNLQEYDTQYAASQVLADSYETAFFSQVKNYYGQTAYDNL